MKLLASLFAILLPVQPTLPQTRILLPSGERQADQATARAEQNVPPPLPPKRTIDLIQVQQDADELATLAASIPTAVNQANHGVIQKDVIEKLKRSEKLAKHLRGEVSP